MSRFDAEIGIGGAGPAGARAGELLAEWGAAVLMLDPKAPWEKPCGGGLPWSAFQNVPALHELLPETQRIHRARIEVSPEEGFTVPLDEPLYMVAREALGRWQIGRAESAGAKLLAASIRSIERTNDGWQVESAEGDTWTVHLLVGADGAASLVRRVVAPGFQVALAPTRVAYPSGTGTTPHTLVVKFYDEVEGYLWDFPRPDHRSLGIGIVAGSWKRPLMDQEVKEYRISREACECVEPERAGAVIGTALLGHGDYAGLGSADFALLGDAAGFADPATGEGIENALRSAALLGEAYAGTGDVSSYAQRARAVFEREFRISRRIRKVLFQRRVGSWLVRRAVTADWAYALSGAVANAANEHDPSVVRLLRRTLRLYRRLRRDPSMARRGGRTSVPCGCTDPSPVPSAASSAAPSAASARG